MRERKNFPFWGGIALPAGVLWGLLLGAAAGYFLGDIMIGAAIGAAVGITVGLGLLAVAIVIVSDGR